MAVYIQFMSIQFKTLFRDDDQVGLKYLVLEKLTGTNSHLTH